MRFRHCLLALMPFAVAACSGIGQGNTVQSLKIQSSPVGILEQGFLVDKDLPTEHWQMYDCFCSTLAVIGKFSDGSLANFSYRAKWTSSDPTVVEVTNKGDVSSVCSLLQQGPGLLTPKKSSGTAVITAEFVGLKASLPVEIVPAGTSISNLVVKPLDATNTGDVAVGGLLNLEVTGTLDQIPRVLSGDVTGWTFDVPAATVASISGAGVVSGLGRDGGNPLTVRATFGACPADDPMAPSMQLRVGDVVAPMTISPEANFAPDSLLALNSNEFLGLVAPLDFDGDGNPDGSQDVSAQSKIDFTEACTVRSYLAGGNGTSTLTDCAEAANPACASSTRVCPTAMTSCATGMTDCRLESPSMLATSGNRIIATRVSGSPATFFGTFPVVPTPTTLSGPALAADSTVTVTSLLNYPTAYPWEAVIDKGTSAEEVVLVTAVDATNLKMLDVTRGYAGTTAQDHASGATFQRRTFGSGTTDLTTDPRTLASLAMEAPSSTTLQPFTTLQLEAQGTFTDVNGVLSPRTQRVTHLSAFSSGSPTTTWTSSQPTVVAVGSATGFITAINACGGTSVIRIRSSTSTSTVDKTFSLTTDPTLDTDGNGNADTNDAECGESAKGGTDNDPLCDQVTITVPSANPLPAGITCP